jgi:16S rRNA C1402 (ribose-2'-O) methylase RsmI
MGTFYVCGAGISKKDMTFKALEILKKSKYILAEEESLAKETLIELGLNPESYSIMQYEIYLENNMIDYIDSQIILNILESGEDVVYLSKRGMPKTDQPRGNIVTRVLCHNGSNVQVVATSDYPSTIMSVSGLGQGDGFLFKDIRGDGVDFINILFPIAKELFAATILLIDKQNLIPKIEAIRSNIGDKVHAALVHGIDTDQVGVVGGNLEYILKHISEYPQPLDNGVIALVVGGKKKENSPEEDSKNARQVKHDWPVGYQEK